MTTIHFCQYSCAEMFGQKYLDVRLFLDIIVWCCHLLSMNCATLCPCIYVFMQLYVHVLCNFMSMYCATLCPCIVQLYVHVYLCPCIVQIYVHALCNFMSIYCATFCLPHNCPNFMSMYCATLCPCIVQLHVHVLCNLMSMCNKLGKDRPRLQTGSTDDGLLGLLQ